MRRLARILALWVGASLPATALADLLPFEADSLDTIAHARRGRPFVLVLWSIDCPPCYKELALLGRLRATLPPGQLVLVSTDAPEQRGDIEGTLARFGLEAIDSYVFADGVPERLRQRIDPDWFGELPRSYLYRADHSRQAISGVLDEQALRRALGQE